MTVKAAMKEAAGFVEEEAGELIDDEEMAQKGRNLRNEGRVQRDEPKTPKLTKPGTGHKED